MLRAVSSSSVRGGVASRVASGRVSAPHGQTREMSALVDKIKEFFIFGPGRTSYQIFPTKKDGAEPYRYPAPGSQSDNVFTPIHEEKDDPYNTNYYVRDTTRNLASPLYVINEKASQLHLPKAGEEPPKAGSPGNKNPAVLRYDPSGTRSAMSTTWSAMESKLQEHLPVHLPKQWNARSGVDVEAECAAKNIPPTPGKPAPWSGPHKEVREGAW